MNRRMFKKVIFSTIMGCLIYFIAINFNNNSNPTSYFKTSANIPLSKEAAMEIAQKEVDYRVNFSKNSKWTFKSKVVNAFPIFMDGIENVKVSTWRFCLFCCCE